MEINELDQKILKVLLMDARQSSRQIAKKVGVSVGTVLTRTKKMEQTGLIKSYTITTDPEKLGYQLTIITEITVSKGKLTETQQEIAKHPNVNAIYDVTGQIDAIIIAKFKNKQEISNFTKYLLNLPYIERTNTHLALTTIKETYTTI